MRQGELLSRSIEEAELGECDAPRGDSWCPSGRRGGRRRGRITRKSSAASHQDATKKQHRRRERV